MIEIAPGEYIKRMPFEDAKLYCFSLSIDGKIGWRLPTTAEYYDNLVITGWRCDEDQYYEWDSKYVTPVRDLKDD